jgi:hypothetical protein
MINKNKIIEFNKFLGTLLIAFGIGYLAAKDKTIFFWFAIFSFSVINLIMIIVEFLEYKKSKKEN